ncbi:hypothetical protein ACJJIK_06020 [Microbulbifer sp. ZKSA006]|uniref:hypothetical protein n=1 Tax=Microbulbifer sp. ZKSA006 TaxID=3243390 RepID=UPI00403A2A15
MVKKIITPAFDTGKLESHFWNWDPGSLGRPTIKASRSQNQPQQHITLKQKIALFTAFYYSRLRIPIGQWNNLVKPVKKVIIEQSQPDKLPLYFINPIVTLKTK